jgi:hypothetical protein
MSPPLLTSSQLDGFVFCGEAQASSNPLCPRPPQYRKLDASVEKIKLAARVVNASSSGGVLPAITETGGAYNSGRSGLTDSFVSGFWFNDLLGALARHGHAFGCRQAILGGHYALLRARERDFAPDLYSMVLWRRLMSPMVGWLPPNWKSSPPLSPVLAPTRSKRVGPG